MSFCGPVHRPEPEEICCNHYKFKSRREYIERSRRLNADGFMAGKFTHESMNGWRADCEKCQRHGIESLAGLVRTSMAKPPASLPNNGQLYNLSVMSIFRAEEDYMEEWLHYYMIQGVDHFFLYANESDISRYTYLPAFLSSRRVTVIDWPDSVLLSVSAPLRRTSWGGIVGYEKISPQNLAVAHFCRYFRRHTEWIAHVDLDEYLFVNATDTLADYVRSRRQHCGIEVPRIDFGSGGLEEKPRGLVIENYFRCQEHSRTYKSIARTECLSEHQSGNAHKFQYVTSGKDS